MLDAEVVLGCSNTLGESCFFDPLSNQLKWLDIDGKKLWMMDVSDYSKVETYDLPEVAGSFTSIEGSSTEYLMAFAKKFAVYDTSKGIITDTLGNELTEPCRLNDGRVDRQGRFVVGG